MVEADRSPLDGSDTMFTQFAAGQGRRERRRGTMVVSVAAHAAAAWLAAVATVRGTPGPPEPPPAVLIYHPPPPAPTARESPRSLGRGERSGGAVRPVPGPAQAARPVAWLDLPDVPPIDEPDGVAGAAAAASAGAALDAGAGGGGGETAVGAGGVWTGPQVDVEARARPGNAPPRYPPSLEQQGVGGSVVARFVVDSAGRVEPGSLTIRTSDHPLLGDAVRRALAGYRFVPAQARGRMVRQLVELPFVFSPRP